MADSTPIGGISGGATNLPQAGTNDNDPVSATPSGPAHPTPMAPSLRLEGLRRDHDTAATRSVRPFGLKTPLTGLPRGPQRLTEAFAAALAKGRAVHAAQPSSRRIGPQVKSVTRRSAAALVEHLLTTSSVPVFAYRNQREDIVQRLDRAGAVDIRHWERLPGTQRGSKAGGMFRDPENGDLHYAKFYATPDYATFELAFLRLYEHGQLHTVDAQLVTLGPRVGIASRWRDDLQTGSVQAFSKADDEELACVYQLSVMADNADFLGWFDNIGYSVDTGRLVVIDVGASMLARSLGQIRLRPDKSVRWFAEDERYRRVLTRVTQLYDPLFARDPALAARGARNLVSFTDDVVATTFNDAGVRPQLAEEATARIRLRRDTILARYGLSHRS